VAPRPLRARTKLAGLVGLAIGVSCAGAALHDSNPNDQTALASRLGERGREPSAGESIDKATLSVAAFSPEKDSGENPLVATRIGRWLKRDLGSFNLWGPKLHAD